VKKTTSREREKDHDLGRRIRAAGIPISTETEDEAPEERMIRQDIEAYEITVFDVPTAPCRSCTTPEG
jgi:hypothetical protein